MRSSCLSCSQQAAELLRRLTDDRTWQSQSPHYGTKAARDLLDAAQRQIPVSLPTVNLSSIKADSLKLPAVQLPSISLPSVNLPSIRADSVKFPSVQLPSFSAPSGQFPKLAAEDLQVAASRISEVTPSRSLSIFRHRPSCLLVGHSLALLSQCFYPSPYRHTGSCRCCLRGGVISVKPWVPIEETMHRSARTIFALVTAA